MKSLLFKADNNKRDLVYTKVVVINLTTYFAIPSSSASTFPKPPTIR